MLEWLPAAWDELHRKVDRTISRKLHFEARSLAQRERRDRERKWLEWSAAEKRKREALAAKISGFPSAAERNALWKHGRDQLRNMTEQERWLWSGGQSHWNDGWRGGL